jgi:hypothetical protein
VTDTVMITDDEALALAARAGVSWPSVTPTIDVGDEAAVRAAVDRGARSLYVRELLGVGGQDRLAPRLEQLVEPLVAGRATLGSYLAGSDYTYVPRGLSVAHYERTPDEWVSEVIVTIGVHYLSTNTPAVCSATTRVLLGAIERDGLLPPSPPEVTGAEFLCTAGPPGAEPLRLVAVRRGEILALHRAGGLSPEVLATLASIDEAMAYLLGEWIPPVRLGEGVGVR